MSYVKTPYYPNKQCFLKITPMGAIELFPEKDLYDKPIEGITIVRIDALQYLEEIWGSQALMCRELPYRLVSGNCTDELYQSTISSMYKRFKRFSDYVDEKWKFGNENENAITRIIKPARDLINNSILNIKTDVENSGGKFLVCTHDYVYASYRHSNIPPMKYAEVIKC